MLVTSPVDTAEHLRTHESSNIAVIRRKINRLARKLIEGARGMPAYILQHLIFP